MPPRRAKRKAHEVAADVAPAKKPASNATPMPKAADEAEAIPTAPGPPAEDAAKHRIVMLLRAVNVSGSNRVPMAKLVEICTAPPMRGRDVQSYLQSGNVALTCSLSPEEAAVSLQDGLEDELGLRVTCFARETAELGELVASCPYDVVGDPTKVHVAFLATEPTEEGLDKLAKRDRGEEQYDVRGRHLFVHYPNGAGRAKLSSSVIEKALGVPLTMRNWRTTCKLAEMAAS